MNITRRNLFGLLAGAVAAVFVKKAPVESIIMESTAVADPAAHVGRHIKYFHYSETAAWPAKDFDWDVNRGGERKFISCCELNSYQVEIDDSIRCHQWESTEGKKIYLARRER